MTDACTLRRYSLQAQFDAALWSLSLRRPSPTRQTATPTPDSATAGFTLHRWPDDAIQAETTTGAAAGDGRVIVAGSISYRSGQQPFATTLERYRSDGTPEAGFGTDGLVRLDLDPAPKITAPKINAAVSINETIYALFTRADCRAFWC